MRTFVRVLSTTACLLLGVAAVAGAGQSSPKPPADDDCLACHGDPDTKRANGALVAVDVAVLAASKHGKIACVSCHEDLATLAEFPHSDTLKKATCASCHRAIGTTYDDSIHARAQEKSGLNVAPGCADCHGRHDSQDRVGRAPTPINVRPGRVRFGTTARL